MIPPVEDEKVGPFLLRARKVKDLFVSIVIDGDKIVQRFDGMESSEAALDAARVYAKQEAALRRPPPRPSMKRATSAGVRIPMTDLRAKFLRHFPEGFTDPAYLSQERSYKEKARADLLAVATAESALSADAETCLALQPAFDTNMVGPFEKMRVRKVLQGAEGPAFLRGSAQLARGDIKEGLATIDAAVRPHGAPSWTIATYLPSLWAPERHILMRITATQQVAAWLGHDFVAQYRSALEPDVYDSLLALADDVSKGIADLAPRDLIDVQSFIWVVASYD